MYRPDDWRGKVVVRPGEGSHLEGLEEAPLPPPPPPPKARKHHGGAQHDGTKESKIPKLFDHVHRLIIH